MEGTTDCMIMTEGHFPLQCHYYHLKQEQSCYLIGVLSNQTFLKFTTFVFKKKIHYIFLFISLLYFLSLFHFFVTQCANEFVCTASDSKPNEIMFWLDLMLLPLVCSIWGDDSGLALGTRSVARWMHPPQGRLKLNCDASVSLKFFCFHCQEV